MIAFFGQVILGPSRHDKGEFFPNPENNFFMTKDYRGKDNRPKNRSLERCQRVITAAIFFYNELKKVGSNQPPPVMIRVNSAAVSEFHFVRLIVGV